MILMGQFKVFLICLSLLFLFGGMSGCAAVKPYEREFLADETMNFDADPAEMRWHLHVREVLEGGRGGFSGNGGGCGCK